MGLLFLRHLLAGLYITLVAVIGFLICLLRPFNPSNMFPIARLLGLSLKIYGIKLEINSKKKLALNTPCVFVSNHQSNMDIFPCAATIPFRTVSLGKTDILWIPFFGQFYWISGNILINRLNRNKAVKSMKNAAKSLREKSISVWIMPEGTRNKNNEILPFKRGAFHTAINAKVPIVPVSISSYSYLNLSRLKTGVIKMKVHPPIETQNLSSEDITDVCQRVRTLIIAGVKELDQELDKEIDKEIEKRKTI